MSKIIKTEFSDEITYTVSCLVEAKEYQEFKDRITDQFIKNVDVKGFRKGKAPRELAMKNLDPIALQQTILEESIEKFYAEVQAEVSQGLSSKGRIPANVPAQIDPTSIKEDDKGLNFTVKVSLLPEIDLEVISKITLDEPKEKDITDRVSKKDFFAKEKESLMKALNSYKAVDRKAKKGDQVTINLTEIVDGKDPNKQPGVKLVIGSGQFPEAFEKHLVGLKKSDKKEFSEDLPHGDHTHKYTFEVECLEVAEAEFKKLEDVLTNSKETKDRFKTEKDFEDFLTKIYDSETQQLLSSLKRRLVIRTVIEKIKDFHLPETEIDKETDRILGTLKDRAESSKQNLATVFAGSGLPKSEDGLTTETEIKEAIFDYVRKEFKLIEILRTSYQLKVDPKVKTAEIDELASQMQKNPDKFNLSPKEAEPGRVKDVAFDRLLRERAYKWIESQITFK
jgi:trigger factor